MVSRVSGLGGLTTGIERRKQRDNQQSQGFAALTPLVATKALQMYLSTDIDAKTKIPRPSGLREKKVSRSFMLLNGKQRGNVIDPCCTNQCNEVKQQESELQAWSQTFPIDSTAIVNEHITSRAESPLSRFQKHIRQTRLKMDRDTCRQVSTILSQSDSVLAARASAARSSQCLAQSLMDKVHEAKRLRQAEAVIDTRHKDKRYRDLKSQASESLCLESLTDFPSVDSSTATVAVLKKTPPIPHAKPVMPLLLSSSREMTLKNDEGTLAHESKLKKTTSSIDVAIMTTNAVLSIQRMWRRKRLPVQSCPRNTEHVKGDGRKPSGVTLIIDKRCKDFTSLFTPAIRRDQLKTEDCLPESDMPRLEHDGSYTGALSEIAAVYPSFHPWTDHELGFLEEGRCIGELYKTVRKDDFINQDELLWKRPHHVIRGAMVQKFRRKRAPDHQAQALIFAGDHNGAAQNPIAHDLSKRTSSIQTPSPSSLAQQTLPSRISTRQRKRKLRRIHMKNRNVALRTSKQQRLRGSIQHSNGKHEETGSTAPICIANKENTQWNAAPEASQAHCRQMPNGSRKLEEQNEFSMFQNETLKADTSLHELDHFVVFSGPQQTTNNDLRNDLIRIDDESLLHDERDWRSNNVVKHYDGFIPLTVALVSLQVTKPCTQNRNGIETQNFEKSAAFDCNAGRQNKQHNHDALSSDRVDKKLSECGDVVAKITTQHCGIQDFCRESEVTCRNLTRSSEDLMVQLERLQSRRDGVNSVLASSPSLPSSGSNSRVDWSQSHLAEVKLTLDDDDTASVKPPMELQSRLQSSVKTSHPRLDEDKRIEFLRVLDDFKRCLRPTSTS